MKEVDKNNKCPYVQTEFDRNFTPIHRKLFDGEILLNDDNSSDQLGPIHHVITTP